MLTCFNVQKTHYFSNTVHYCSSSMPRLSQTRSFLQSPSFQQVRSALIGQLTQSRDRHSDDARMYLQYKSRG